MAEQATKIVEKVGDATPEALTKAIPMDIPPQVGCDQPQWACARSTCTIYTQQTTNARLPDCCVLQHQPVHPGVEHEMKPRPVFISEDYRVPVIGHLQRMHPQPKAFMCAPSNFLNTFVGIRQAPGQSGTHYRGRQWNRPQCGNSLCKGGSQGHCHCIQGIPGKPGCKGDELVEKEGSKCLAMQVDVGDADACKRIVDNTLTAFGQIDVLVNNAAEQYYHHSILEISNEELDRVYATNIFSFFFLSQACLPHLKPGSSILNCASVTAFMGYPELLHYATTKGAIVSYTRSLAQSLIDRGESN
ncbi:hypothetical protein DUNSADRAFT_17573 [Dunaliella salina]|uniref:Uncharacterized protein n=1 Tax=Dunaliella salina TaxID=3046 RepID=A0ABQ7G1I5_DUNSA|nr:hypothetical protein DUNSADRAFT_17573 [Dunaliella salina]|eukprot:KAF5828465.1 hypothetical protein DUNSADRAFT_17573 [Dunaliella salina]